MSQSNSEKTEYVQFRITPFQQALASCSGALITSFFVTPFDVIKTRMQAQQKTAQSQKCFLYCNGLMDHICSCNDTFHKAWIQRPSHFNGTFDAFVKISQNEGLNSLWSGLSPTLVLAIPSTMIYFVCYEQIRVRLKDYYNQGSDINNQVQPYWIPLLSGSFARMISVLTVNPLELIRTKMQSKKVTYTEIGEALQNLINHEGVKGLWRGIFPTLMRDVPFSAFYWWCYETFKAKFTEPNLPPPFVFSFFAGAVSGGLAATVTLPFDVIKTHQQIEFGEVLITERHKKRMSTMEKFKEIHRKHGTRGLFTGIIPRLIKVAPACAIMISTYEYSKVFFYRYNEEIKLKGDLNDSLDYYDDSLFPVSDF